MTGTRRSCEVNAVNSSSNRNLVVNSALAGQGNRVSGWKFVTPRADLKLGYGIRGKAANGRRLVLMAAGDQHAFGCWQGEARLRVGKWYRASVRVSLQGIAHPELSVFAQVAQHFLVPKTPWANETVLEQVFQHSRVEDGNHVELYLRATRTGEAEWSQASVIQIPRPEQRICRVATTRFGNSDAPLTLATQRQRIAARLDQAGALQPDVAVLTEFSPVVGVPRNRYRNYWNAGEEIPGGPVCRVLSGQARRYRMYVIAGILERDAGHLFNTAVLFDRRGKLAGFYRKTHLTFGELREGISCGDRYPVFDLDFGRIGIHICYDEWFPEVARYYAHQGAEILFLPVAGGKPITWRTRALDNGIYFVSSSITPPSMIIDSSGAILAETHDDGVACADLNLDYRKTNWYGDPTLTYGMPCTVPQMRNVLDHTLLEGLSNVVKTAWK